ncbi:MAG: hypothetical protein Q9216_000555 [Gyalolechia sp. 2 TL-2023]
MRLCGGGKTESRKLVLLYVNHQDLGRMELGTNATSSIEVDSKDSLENVESKWVGEIAENCQGVKLVLVALKCDLRTVSEDDDDGVDDDPSQQRKEKDMIDYKEGLEVARRIQALRYLGNLSRLLPPFISRPDAEISGRMLRKTESRCE